MPRSRGKSTVRVSYDQAWTTFGPGERKAEMTVKTRKAVTEFAVLMTPVIALETVAQKPALAFECSEPNVACCMMLCDPDEACFDRCMSGG